MSSHRSSSGRPSAGRKGRARKAAREQTPASATSTEKERIGEDAVSKAVTVDEGTATGVPKSVLPGPPIPPERQAEVREHPRHPAAETVGNENNRKGKQPMIEQSRIKEHMEVVGSDGEHVGTVDRCEGNNRIKLTKNDPAADGQHHYIPLGWVAHVDQRVHLAHSGADARRNWA